MTSLCQFQTRLNAFHDGELDLRASREVTLHLAECEACRQELAGVREVSRVLGHVRPREMTREVLARLHDGADDLTARADVLPLARVLMAMAASVVVIGAAWLVQSPTGGPAVTPSPIVVTPSSDWERIATGQIDRPNYAGGNTGVAESDPAHGWNDPVNDWINASLK
ncbi:MAG: hypothetical protein JWP03_4379 [Phycisphaerales bacterium]|nr:hypothetical protein [Phycisphaerales bacterium]